ncbi:MAG TPA: phosphoribosyltransferase family protein [Nitrospira sp.]|nr:phosphoribosyltransferase family protein [Nitrospira sp.]
MRFAVEPMLAGVAMVLRNREEAGRLLAARLHAYRNNPNGLILALPRGGVAVAYEISVALRLPLDVFITRKLGAPDNPEYAIGALSETGAIYLNADAVEAFQLSHADLDALIKDAREEITARQQRYRNGLPLATITGRTVILVDDGMATGATFFATIEAITELSPGRLVAALPVAPRDNVAPLRSRVDDVIILDTPEPFIAVGHHYHSFTQVDDAQVLEYLKAAKQSRTAQSSTH